jgi:hypothetical protein
MNSSVKRAALAARQPESLSAKPFSLQKRSLGEAEFLAHRNPLSPEDGAKGLSG